MFRIVVSYDGFDPHWSKQYDNFSDAVNAYGNFTDWGFADEFSIVTLHAGNYMAQKTLRRPN